MQDRYQQIRERVVYHWPTYGPPILGMVLVLLALFIGYRILSNRNESQLTSRLQDSNLSLNIDTTPAPGEGEPVSNVTLPDGTTPTPTGGVALATDGATLSAMTKGGQLPNTGFPVVLALPGFAAAVFAGSKLLRAQK